MEKRQISLKKQVLPILVTVLLICTVILCFTVVVQVLTQGHASLFGHSLFRVVTGSMEPSIPTGTLIISRSVDIESLDINDIICFYSLSPSMRGRIITHRVVGREVDEDGAILLLTKGDANPSIDSYAVTQDNLVGKVVWNSSEDDFLNNFVAFFSKKFSFLACIAFPCLLIAGLIFRNCVRNVKKDIENAMEALLELEQKEKKATSSTVKRKVPPPSTTISRPPQPKEGVPGQPQTPHSLVGQESGRQIPAGISQREYEEMIVRIRAELIEEMKREMSARIRAELLEELKQENDREQSKKQ